MMTLIRLKLRQDGHKKVKEREKKVVKKRTILDFNISTSR